MSITKSVTILGIWGMVLAAFLRYVDYMERHDLGPGYFRWPVIMFIIGAVATVDLLRGEP